jgi:hypothetical protein
MNVRKMRQIGKDILAEPRRFNIRDWAQRVHDRGDLEDADHAVTALPPCGTVMCFAGEWAIRYLKMSPADLVVRKYDKAFNGLPLADAARLDLQMPNESLFFESRWPLEVEFSSKMKAGTKNYAEHFVNVVLESYIRTNGWENGKA